MRLDNLIQSHIKAHYRREGEVRALPPSSCARPAGTILSEGELESLELWDALAR